jgi:hypothetical protein
MRTRAIITTKGFESAAELERVPIFGALYHAGELLCMIAVRPIFEAISGVQDLWSQYTHMVLVQSISVGELHIVN